MKHMPSVLRFAYLLAMFSQLRKQALTMKGRRVVNEALDDVISELVLGYGDETT